MFVMSINTVTDSVKTLEVLIFIFTVHKKGMKCLKVFFKCFFMLPDPNVNDVCFSSGLMPVFSVPKLCSCF